MDLPETYSGRQIAPLLHIEVDGVPMGELGFSLWVQKKHPRADEMAFGMGISMSKYDVLDAEHVSESPLPYKTAFLSYSRKDFEKVYLFAEGLEQNGMKLFVDVNSIEPGEQWKTELERAIQNVDVFYLMWSANAASSPMVEFECRKAHERSNKVPDKRPRIKPITLYRGAPPPPDFLHDLEFNSKWLLQREAQKHPLFSTPQH